MATALSRSETEQKAVPAALRLGNTFAERTRLGAGAAAEWGAEKPGCRQLPKLPLGSPVGGGLYAASVFSPEKKTRKKKAPTTPPQLLVQDAETTGRQIEDRVAQLLSEEVEPSSTPPLPTSRILEEELARGSWALRPPGGAQNLLWEARAPAPVRALGPWSPSTRPAWCLPWCLSGPPRCAPFLWGRWAQGERVEAPAAAPSVEGRKPRTVVWSLLCCLCNNQTVHTVGTGRPTGFQMC